MLTKEAIEKRRVVLINDIKTINEKMITLTKAQEEARAMANALTGAIQQCDAFLKEVDASVDTSSSIPNDGAG